jgi:hypothetical protein
MTTFSEADRLPFYYPKDPPVCTPPELESTVIRNALAASAEKRPHSTDAFLEMDPTHRPGAVVNVGIKPYWGAHIVSTKETNPKDAVGTRKAPLSVVPMNVVAEAGAAMLEGALKYGRHNYRDAGIRESVYFDGTMRHLIAYWEGEDIDPDSGVSHLTKAIASLLVWRDAQMNGYATDDRPPKARPFYPDLNARAAALVDAAKARGASPKHFTEKGTK